jgi:serine/threonine-protein kinase
MLLALDAIHARGMYHRDVKPDNIMISKTMDAKIIDFGIAKLLDSRLTLPFQVMGTPAYMAPEAFLSAEVDHRADIFSMGVLAYELLVGRRPFGGESIPVLAGQIRTMAPQDPRRFLPNFPPGLQDILARMLRKQPDSRYQSTQEVLEDIDAFTAGAPALRHAHGNGFFGRLFSRDWR